MHSVTSCFLTVETGHERQHGKGQVKKSQTKLQNTPIDTHKHSHTFDLERIKAAKAAGKFSVFSLDC